MIKQENKIKRWLLNKCRKISETKNITDKNGVENGTIGIKKSLIIVGGKVNAVSLRQRLL